MGDGERTPFMLKFDSKVRLGFRGLLSPQTQDFWHAENSPISQTFQTF